MFNLLKKKEIIVNTKKFDKKLTINIPKEKIIEFYSKYDEYEKFKNLESKFKLWHFIDQIVDPEINSFLKNNPDYIGIIVNYKINYNFITQPYIEVSFEERK